MQDKKNGFSLVEAAIVLAVLSIFSAVAIPAFNCARRRAISTAAQETIRQIKEECETNYIYGVDKFTSSNPDKYQISASGTNSCSGGTVTLTPEDTKIYPTYLYKFADSELSYNFKGQTGISFVACNKLICGNSSENTFKDKLALLIEKKGVCDKKFFERGNSIYVVVAGDTWEKAQENAKFIGGNLSTINDVDENDWLVKTLFGRDKTSSIISDQYALEGEPLRGQSIWLGHTYSSIKGDYVSIAGEENIYTNWAPGEKGDGLNKGEKYTSFILFDNINRDPGMVMSSSNRQYNTPKLIERGGAHLFCGLAEVKKN